MQYQDLYDLWVQNATADPDLVDELRQISTDADGIADRFYKDLEFGTGGLRGVIGAGTNRMNVYTVGRATQGLADYIRSAGGSSVAIAHDSRIKSDLFAKTAAQVFAANGITVHFYKELMPTPMLSYAVRALHCDAGVVVTASHNPAKYNGYKVYGPDGCQLTLDASEQVLQNIEQTDLFSGVKKMDFDAALQQGLIRYIGDDVIQSYLDAVYSQSVHPELLRQTDLRVVYTPLHGAGNKPVRAILKKAGVKQVIVVPSQELPDGNFPTAPYPNPEIRQAFEQALLLAKTEQPDLLLATDPDCDRVGIAVRSGDEYVLMSGNEVGALLLDYILRERKAAGTLPAHPVVVKTIVTTDLAQKIADSYGCEVRNVLTGFKFIGEQIGLLEQNGQADRYIFGFEESYGYLSGGYVRDKDAVDASLLICEMAAFYKQQGKTLLQVMDALYQQHGYFVHTQLNFTFEGITGMEKMQQIMTRLRKQVPSGVGGLTVQAVCDYESSQKRETATGAVTPITLPKSNVISYLLEHAASAIVRPSGTEPKIKVYVTAVGQSREQAQQCSQQIAADMTALLQA